MAAIATPRRASVGVAGAYDCLAPFYDQFTDGYAYEGWLAEIERRAVGLGLRGRRALDLACGTGKSTEPLLARGYSVLACDISEAMVREAREKFPEHADAFVVADMRDLPWIGAFDLVLCLDDAINYLLSEDDLDLAFAGVARSLSPDGIFAFDLNSLLTYRTAFAETTVTAGDGVLFIWRGEGRPEAASCELASAAVEIFAERPSGAWERASMRHVQRHHSPEVVRAALARAGLECAAVAGQHPGARLVDHVDDELHTKLMYFARHAEMGRR
jgi:SAM-dependent methyltransferase